MINENRIKHIFAVARLMKDYSIEKFDIEYAKQMFTLGLLHDIGYEFGDNKTHPIIGGEMLQNQNYKYYNEIKYHGSIDCEYSSFELDLLNWADMHINGCGEKVSYEERLLDIKNRYGEESDTYKNARILIDKLIEKGFN